MPNVLFLCICGGSLTGTEARRRSGHPPVWVVLAENVLGQRSTKILYPKGVPPSLSRATVQLHSAMLYEPARSVLTPPLAESSRASASYWRTNSQFISNVCVRCQSRSTVRKGRLSWLILRCGPGMRSSAQRTWCTTGRRLETSRGKPPEEKTLWL